MMVLSRIGRTNYPTENSVYLPLALFRGNCEGESVGALIKKVKELS